MKINHKLIFAFGVLIVILLAEIILNQIVSDRAKQTYNTLQTEIYPVVDILNKYKPINKELYLLTSSRINGDAEISSINRLKGIIEVELSYIKKELRKLQYALPGESGDRQVLENIITDTERLKAKTSRANRLLIENKERGEVINNELSILKYEIEKLNTSIDRNIDYLNLQYKRASAKYNNELSNSLEAVSNFILITGIFGIILAIIITIQVTYSISEPIKKMKNAAFKMSEGNLDERVSIKGSNELADLGKSFNSMSDALKKSFSEQDRQLTHIKAINKELEQFVYVASHDLQEPLRTMSSYVGLIRELYIEQLDDNALKYVKHVEDASLRMKTLIKDLLDYSKIGKEKEVSIVDLNRVVEDILLDHELIIKDTGASIQVDNLPTLKGFDIELKQLFQNLINNGLKFRKKDTLPEIQIRVEEQPNYWLFSVKDNGIGMEKKYFERVFVIFQRLHNKDDYAGTGIGLSICKKIVDMHKGKIWIESKLDHGTTFYFTIYKRLTKHEEI